MRFNVSVILALLSFDGVRADDLGIATAKAKALALLELNKFQTRDGEPCGACVDLDTAYQQSDAEKKFIMIWVGGCDPAFRVKFPDCVHANVKEYKGSAKPRVVIPTTIGEYQWSRERVTVTGVRTVIGGCVDGKCTMPTRIPPCPGNCKCECEPGEPCQCHPASRSSPTAHCVGGR